MELSFEWNKPKKQICYEKSGKREGYLRLANSAARFMDPYVPANNLVLAQNIRITADEKAGHVTYNSPYAHYQYEGILYVDPNTGSAWSTNGANKIPTSKKLEYSNFRHPLATDHWDKAMWTARKRDLASEYEYYLKHGG